MTENQPKAVIFRPQRLRLHRLERFRRVRIVEPGRIVNAEIHGDWLLFSRKRL
jgi:hypothetical protein